MILAPLLLITGATLFIGIYDQPGAAHLAAAVAHRARAMAAVNCAIAGVVIAAIAVAGLATMVSLRQPRLGRLGGILTLVGLFGPGFFLGVNFLTIALAGLEGRTALVDALATAEKTLSIVNVTGPALVVGLILLAVGSVKSGVLTKPRGWALGLAAVAPVGFISGVIVIAAAAWTCLAAALVPLGIQCLRSARPDIAEKTAGT